MSDVKLALKWKLLIEKLQNDLPFRSMEAWQNDKQGVIMLFNIRAGSSEIMLFDISKRRSPRPAEQYHCPDILASPDIGRAFW
ncbi:MAG: Exopolyphosphatase [Candidatus Tokpelaia sp. JSC188]|nr:MAG: Exopolyphosphatase [Candidatus Tokpelaia sp. JSC188]